MMCLMYVYVCISADIVWVHDIVVIRIILGDARSMVKE